MARNLVASVITSIRNPNQDQTSATSNPLQNAPQDTQTALLTLHVLFPNEFLPALDTIDRGLITRLTAQHATPPAPGTSQLLPVPSTGGSLPGTGLSIRQEDTSPQALRSAADDLQTHTPREDAIQVVEGEADFRSHHLHLPHLDRQSPALRSIEVDEGSSIHRRHAELYVVRSGQLPARARAVNQHTTSYEVRLDAWTCSCPAFAFSAFPAATSDDIDITYNIDNGDTSSTGWRFGGLTLGIDLPVCKHLLACILVEHSSVFAGFVDEREVSVEELAGWAAG